MAKDSGASEVSRTLALASELGFALTKLKRRLREQAHVGDFSESQKSVIRRLERDGRATVAALAKAESVRHQSMRVTVASLEAAGVVSGKPDPGDGRQTIIGLTPAFLKVLKTGRAARADWLFRALQAQLTPREQEKLAAAVEFLNRLSEF
jgi:DNA-binding MarR family transcriptional regulator